MDGKVTQRQLYELAVTTWGAPAQVGMFHEEVGEALVALNKVTRQTNGCTVDKLLEELVDLEIMVEQLQVIYNLSPLVWERVKKAKLHRLAQRLNVDLVGVVR